MRDIVQGTTRLASSLGLFLEYSISGDGRYVVFTSQNDDRALNDNNRNFDVFVRDMVNGTTELVSVNLTGTSSTAYGVLLAGAYNSRISADGRYVIFESDYRDLAANDLNDSVDLFVRDRQTRTTIVVSVNRAGQATGNRSRLTSGGFFNFDQVMTPDGRFVAFNSSATNLVPNKTDFLTQDVFVRDLAAGTTTLVSVNTAGADSQTPRGGGNPPDPAPPCSPTLAPTGGSSPSTATPPISWRTTRTVFRTSSCGTWRQG